MRQLTSPTPASVALRPAPVRRRPCEDCLAAECCAERAAEHRAADGLGLPPHWLPPLRPAVRRAKAGNLRARLLTGRPGSASVPASRRRKISDRYAVDALANAARESEVCGVAPVEALHDSMFPSRHVRRCTWRSGSGEMPG